MSNVTISENKNFSHFSYIEWGSVIAGTVLACSVSLVLLQFGNALGLSTSSLRNVETITSGKLLIIGLWLLWVQLMASMAGGYLAGRMRAPWGNNSHESEMRDGTHGLLVWATSSLVVAVAAALATFLATYVAQQGVDTKELPVSANMIRKSGIIIGFSLTASYLVSAVAAWWMGTVGGDHRDNEVDASRFASFRKSRKTK